jgi:hypothetical protein
MREAKPGDDHAASDEARATLFTARGALPLRSCRGVPIARQLDETP